MYPSYARILAFDESHTKFASKYSLYLYREQGKDPIPDEKNGYDRLSGIPVLFIPGNAGSYRQVRSIAAETANIYFGNNGNIENPNAQNFDFFSADFNEDFTAFHGRTMLDQAEFLNEAVRFILELYADEPIAPKSVILLGHSMGGVVARVMLTLPNYVDHSVNTIITLASPHAAAPLTFDGDILKIYSAIDRFWFDGFNNSNAKSNAVSEIASSRLRDVSLLSITGGLTDSTLPADYTTLSFLVPPSNGFTVYTTGIPGVWTNVDHLAIVWCDQLRKKVAKALLEIADRRSATKTYSLEERMSIFRRTFLSGFEDYTTQDYAPFKTTIPKISMKLDLQQINSFSLSGEKKLKLVNANKGWNVFHLQKEENLQFNLLSSKEPLDWKTGKDSQNSKKLTVLLCNNLSEDSEDETPEDLTNEQTKEFITVKCIEVSKQAHIIPPSVRNKDRSSKSSPFYALQYNSTVLSHFDVLLVSETHIEPEEFVIAELSEYKSTQFQLGKDLSSLFSRGADISLPANRPLSVNIHIPGAWSSLLSYRLKLNYGNKSPGSFESIIRQWIDQPYESKWHVNAESNNDITLRMHGIAPFVPFKIKDSYGLNIQLWSDSTSNNKEDALDIELQIDLLDSFRSLVMRYRLSLVAVCVSISLLVSLIQFQMYFRTGKFPNFIYVLSYINSGWPIIAILGGLCFLNYIVKIEWIQNVLNLIDPVVLRDSNEINLSLRHDFKLNSFYLGLEENSLWFISVIFYLMGTFLVFATYYALSALSVVGTLLTWINKSKAVDYSSPSRRRIIVTVLLVMLIPIYIPYQIVYVISCVIQLFNVLKSVNNAQLFNYQMSLLIPMLWILPINIPIVIVFVHNISINWKTPFSSHHNLLSIVPILLLTERNSLLVKLPKKRTNQLHFTWYLGYFIFYCIVYGSRHTYWMHHLFNLMSCLVLIIMYGEEETDGGMLETDSISR
ncbi:PGAP1-like protein-domain-containing protein [Scheffersomyces xylosifermentans]|uniref:PGAP1-like protein-domain-containing protein n=1 Tax=Scheffersomyces xylosifermentans TaxID=1304137 RepID=UPI00315DEB36